MIEINQLSFKYPRSSKLALDNIDLKVKKGDFVCMIGPSGSGKSTLLMALNGLIPHHIPGDYNGNVIVDGMVVENKCIRDISQKVGLVFQNPETQICNLKVRDEVAFGPENLLVPPSEILRRVRWSLKAVGMADYDDRNPEELSYGQKQRITIGSVLSMKPRVLLLDEPLSNLDNVIAKKVLYVLKELNEQNITIIVTTHDIKPFQKIATHLVALAEGKILLDKAVNELDKRDKITIKNLGIRWGLKKTPRRKIKNHNKPVIEVKHLDYTYPNNTKALNNLSLKIRRGEFVGIIGNNGSGKTTLLKAMVGFIKPQKGHVSILGLRDPNPCDLFGNLGFLYQNPDIQIFEKDVFEEIAFSLKNMGLDKGTIDKRISWALETVSMAGHKDKNPLALSLGERHRVALASILAMNPKLLILDELTSGIDYKTLTHILRVIKEIQKRRDMTVIMVTHDDELLPHYADRIIKIDNGKVVGYE